MALYEHKRPLLDPLGNQQGNFQALAFTLFINGKPARVLADKGTIGATLISNQFVTTHNIPYTANKNPVALKIVGKVSRSTSNYRVKVMIYLGKTKGKDVEMMVTPVSDYDVLLSTDDHIELGAVI